jgi:DNA polymerase III delta prime subunit
MMLNHTRCIKIMKKEKSIVWKNLIAQERVKEMLGAAYGAGSLGHAYLFCGEEGVGKFAAALELSLALLCADGRSVPCYTCGPCRKALSNNHPDLHVIFPVLLDESHKSGNDLNQKGWEFIASLVPKRIKTPYMPLSYENEDIDKSALHKVPAIPVEWIKEVNEGILRGAVEGERTVTIFCDVDTMNTFSANAMLKTLEEPPANTYLFLTTSKPEAVLPTIASRCQIVRFGHVPAAQIQQELAAALGPAAAESKIMDAVYYSMGSLGRALTLIKTEEQAKGLTTLQETAQGVKEFWGLCSTGDWLQVAPALDALAREKNLAVHEQFFTYLLYLMRNSFLQKKGCSENYIDGSNILDDPNGIFNDPAATDRLTRACNQALSGVRKYGHIGIILVNFVVTLMEILHVEKQQAC